jgi:2-dehydro-3-deoxygluconokinase
MEGSGTKRKTGDVMSRVVCFGELLLRMSPEMNGAWIKNQSMPVFIGGAELNAATALSHWNKTVDYCTILPPNALSADIIAHIQSHGIGTGKILSGGNRIGSYFLPQGADLKNAGVIYDRAFSSFWDLKPGLINWDNVFEDASWFHFSAITPALNADLAAVCKEALEAASLKGITISVDLNYRAKLWQYGKQPSEVMPELVQYCDVIMGNLWAAEKMLGIKVDPALEDNKSAYLAEAEKNSKLILQQFNKCSCVANTFRFEKGEGVKYYATLMKDESFFVSPEMETDHIVDKVGSGDTFMAGLIYGHLQESANQELIDFAASAAFNKLFIKGDASTAPVEDIIQACKNYV